MRKLTDKEREVYNSYHLPSMSCIHKRKINSIHISPANSLAHEQKKLEICYDLQCQGSKYVTEAVRNRKDSNGKERRVDVVCISSGIEFEAECDMKRALRFLGQEKVVIVPVGWSKDDKKWKELLKKHGKEIYNLLCKSCKIKSSKSGIVDSYCNECQKSISYLEKREFN